MRLQIKLLLLTCIATFAVKAQGDALSPIGGNAALIQYESKEKSTFAYNNFIFTTDTLQLPFVDDFSTNTLLARDYSQMQILDTVEFATGSCVLDGDFSLLEDSFSLTPTYTYFFDSVAEQIDSTINVALSFEFFDGPDCFQTPSVVSTFYPQAIRYTFDTTGLKLDSMLLQADTLLSYTALYFANLDPSGQWIDNYAFQNTTFAKDPPTIGVATLDGLNEFGRPYNNSVVNPIGQADFLTSKPIDLSGLMNDSAVCISFFVQAQGLGDAPNLLDSLVLEFKNEYENTWVKAWGINIDNLNSGGFKQFYVAIRDTNLVTGPRYFYEDFQFRFRNTASLSGNNDHWHIDYVRLDKNRALVEQDTVIRDVAFMYDFPNVLEKYSTLPWSQFQAGADEFAATISIPIRDNGQINGVSAGSFPIDALVTDSLDTDTIYELTGVNFNPTSEIKVLDLTPNLDFVKPTFEGDSIFVNSRMGMAPTSRNLINSNDTIYSQIHFDKILAYDDGSAEKAYGLSGSTNEVKKFAYKFEVAHPDTLAGIQIHFSNIDEDVSDLVFNFVAWDSIEVNIPLSYEHEIGVINNQKPDYIDIQNGFVTYVFDTPILVTNTFYIGWEQTDTRNLQIGYDRNSTKGRLNMFTYLGSTWRLSNINEPGSPMIRAILDADFDFEPATGISSISNASTVKVYPNPTTGIFTIDVPQESKEFQVQVYDYQGKLVHHSSNQKLIDVQHLNTGVYLVHTRINGQLFQAKVVKH